MRTYFADDGWLEKGCTGCGKPAAEGEEIEIVQASSSEGLWMHRPCAERYFEWCEKEHEDFYANEVMKFVRGEASGITPGTVGEARAKGLVSIRPYGFGGRRQGALGWKIQYHRSRAHRHGTDYAGSRAGRGDHQRRRRESRRRLALFLVEVRERNQ
jgi:hypothetical protein